MFAQDIIEPRSRKRCRSVLCEEGLAAAAEAGAKQLCLGGLTGALSLYGRLLEGPAANHGITITTGHSTTAVSVLKSYLRAIADLNLRPSSGRMAVLGLGSIGSSFMNLLLHCQPDTLPSRIVVVERPNREKYVQGLMANYRERTDIPIDLELTGPDGRLAPGTVCYDSTFVVSAVSTPYVIDIDQVAPGTVLIDDSQPYCWSRGDAWRRCSGQLDIVPCDAGLVHCGNIGYLSTFPFGFADANGEGQKIAWSCMAEGLLRLVAPELPATVGEPDDKSLQLYAAAFDGCGFSIPPLQCDGKLLPIEELRECFAQTQTTCAGEC